MNPGHCNYYKQNTEHIVNPGPGMFLNSPPDLFRQIVFSSAFPLINGNVPLMDPVRTNVVLIGVGRSRVIWAV